MALKINVLSLLNHNYVKIYKNVTKTTKYLHFSKYCCKFFRHLQIHYLPISINRLELT